MLPTDLLILLLLPISSTTRYACAPGTRFA
jgi:hypothetical protein